jgi:hypothetical protein
VSGSVSGGDVTIPQGPGHTGIVQEVRDWIDQPFKAPIDLASLFLITGMVLVFIGAWSLILYHVRIAATEMV